MPKKTDNNLENTTKGKNSLSTSAPYENVLNTAFSKLTSEILVFLLAYMILLVVLVWIGPTLGTPLLGLFYVIPVLGIIFYVWVKRQRIVAMPQDSRDVTVKVRKAEGESSVVGERGVFPTTAGSTVVTAGHVRDQARVEGRAINNTTDASAQLLIPLFEKLDQRNQWKLISNAQSMLNKQEDSHS